MISILAERMPANFPFGEQIARCDAAQKERPADGWTLAGPFSLKE
jgi:hypothetical protein